jgi:hypothetical protein
MITPRGHERGAVAAAGDVEPDRVAIERLRLRHVADAQMHMADAQPVRCAVEARIRGHFAQDVIDVERIGGDAQIATSPLPAFRRPVGVDLDAVAFGIIEVEGFAHRVIGCAGQGHLRARGVKDPAREIGARGHQESGVIESGFTRVVGLGGGRALEMQEGHVARAEGSAVLATVQHNKANRVAIKAGEPVEIAHLEPDRADVQRGAAREGRES